MSIHLENASAAFGLKMEILSQTASTDMTVRTQVNKSEYLDRILEGTVGFKSKNELRNFQKQGMMYFFDSSGYVQVRFVGEFNENDIKKFINGINEEYLRLTNPTAYQNKQKQHQMSENNEQTLKIKKELEELKLQQEKVQKQKFVKKHQLSDEERKIKQMEKERLNIERRLNEQNKKENLIQRRRESDIQSQINAEKEKIRNLENNFVSSRILQENKKISEMKIEKEKLKSQLKEREFQDYSSIEKELIEKELKEKERELELKEKYENVKENYDDKLIILENNSNSLIVSSNLTDISVINQVLDSSYLGFSSRKELKQFQNIGDIKINQNNEGTYDFIFVGDYKEKKAKEYVENITAEYSLIIQENTYLKVLDKIKENNMALESEVIDNEDSIVLTINI